MGCKHWDNRRRRNIGCKTAIRPGVRSAQSPARRLRGEQLKISGSYASNYGIMVMVLVSIPRPLLTSTAADPSAIPEEGIVTVRDVAVLAVTTALTVAILTAAFAMPVPVIVIWPPLATDEGVMPVMTGGSPIDDTVILLVAEPCALETFTCFTPIVEPIGILVVIEVSVLAVVPAAIPPISTVELERLLPEMVILSPEAPLEGVIELILGPLPFPPSLLQLTSIIVVINTMPAIL